MTTADGHDRDYLVRWRAAIGFALDAGLSEEPPRALRVLVASIEQTGGRGASRLAELRASHGLSLEQVRMLACVLCDRGSRLSARELCCIAFCCTEAELDGEQAYAELAALVSRGLVRVIDPVSGEQHRRHAPGPALRELAALARELPRARWRGPRRTSAAPPAPQPDAPSAPEGAAVLRLRRWELELWATCFRTRLVVHNWINGHRDPYKEFAGNNARAFDAGAADALATEAARIERELTERSDGEPTALEHLERTFDIGPAHARVLLYLFLGEVLEVALPLLGRNVLAALGPVDVPPPVLSSLLGPTSPLLTKRLVTVPHKGPSLYTSQIALGESVLARIGIDPAALPPPSSTLRAANELLGDLRRPRVTLADVILPSETHEALLDALTLIDPRARAIVPPAAQARLLYKGKGTTLLFEGPPGTGKTMAAEALAHHLGRPLYLARVDRIEDMMLGNSQKNMVRLFAEASREGAVLLLDEADGLVARRTPVHQAWDQHRNTNVNLFLGEVEEHDGIVILTTNLAVNLDPALERRLTARVRFGLPGLAERERLWRTYTPSDVAHEGELDLPRLARQYPMSGARIRNAVLSALRKELRRRVGVGGAEAAGEGPLVLRAGDLASSAADELRSAYRDRFERDDGAESESVGELREPARDLASVVLTPAMRARLSEALVALSPEARTLFTSSAFLDTFRTGRGAVLLFDGPPGTGKTTTAEAIAGELGKRMYLMSPERVLSKWLGQSERALARAFDEAEAMDAVLVMDEADSLLEARADGAEYGGRTANHLVNILLRRLDEASGVAILITNRTSALDPALERRLTARLTFPMPDAAQRAEILRRHTPDGVELAGDVDLAELARSHPLSGAHLRNAMLAAIRRMVLRDPAQRTLERALLEEALVEVASSGAVRAIGFRSA